MSQPRVLCVCLTRNRPEMLKQAVRCFERQTYWNRSMLIWDTGELGEDFGNERIHHIPAPAYRKPEPTLGELRNEAIAFMDEPMPNIIAHLDDDDWSHPRRLEEQVELLELSGADCVGYRQLLFWREIEREAWLYTGAICGTSLMYRREAWERNSFPAISHGEDNEWLVRVPKVKGVSCFTETWLVRIPKVETITAAEQLRPRLVARIHAGNAGNSAYWPEQMAKHPDHWRRAPEWDEYCSRMDTAP